MAYDQKFLGALSPEGRAFLEDRDPDAAWSECKRGDWMAWWLATYFPSDAKLLARSVVDGLAEHLPEPVDGKSIQEIAAMAKADEYVPANWALRAEWAIRACEEKLFVPRITWAVECAGSMHFRSAWKKAREANHPVPLKVANDAMLAALANAANVARGMENPLVEAWS